CEGRPSRSRSLTSVRTRPRLCPPEHTRFPYTTLFRSHARHRRHDQHRDQARRTAARHLPLGRPRRTASEQDRIRRPQFVGLDLEDRKSTRLNSSHQIISYAVFCLKKKKKTAHRNKCIT